MNKINILYTTDHNYVKYMLVSLYSLLENNLSMYITVHVICDKFEAEDYKIVENVIKSFENANIYFYDFKKISKLIEKYNIPDWRGTKIANARLFFTSCIKDADKLLYLDSDTVVVNSLSRLECYDGTINMVQDLMPKNYWQNLAVPLEKYCNSGVLWIDVNKWKEKDCDKRIIDMLKMDIHYDFPDQDLLNMALCDDIELLSPEYNLFSIDAYYNLIFLYKYYRQEDIERYSIEEIVNAKNNPIILHSTPFYSFRPMEKNNLHPYSGIYDEYLYKLHGEIDNNCCIKSTNALLFKLYLYSKLTCPKKFKDTVKKLIRK